LLAANPPTVIDSEVFLQTNRQEIIRRSLDVVIEELEAERQDGSCILAHKVLRDVLAKQGIIDSFPLTVNPIILNPALTDEYERDPNIVQQEDVNWDARGFLMVRFEGEGDGRWPAHLVTIVPNSFPIGAGMIDLTIGRVNRFGHGLNLGMIVMGVREAFLEGNYVYTLILNGCRIIYSADPGDSSFRDTDIWRASMMKNRIVKRAIRRLGV